MDQTLGRKLKVAICEALDIDPNKVTDIELEGHARGIVHLRIGLYPDLSDAQIQDLASALKAGGHVIELWNGRLDEAHPMEKGAAHASPG